MLLNWIVLSRGVRAPRSLPACKTKLMFWWLRHPIRGMPTEWSYFLTCSAWVLSCTRPLVSNPTWCEVGKVGLFCVVLTWFLLGLLDLPASRCNKFSFKNSLQYEFFAEYKKIYHQLLKVLFFFTIYTRGGQTAADTGCSSEDLPEAMDDREG